MDVRLKPREVAGDGYVAISDYAVIGDCRAAALVSRQGSIDWLCLPHFSGLSLFAAILDSRRGGCFVVRPAGAVSSRRRYVGDTNVLETTFETGQGVLRLTDLMPVSGDERTETLEPQRELLRIVECLSGTVELEVRYEPRPDYARVRPKLKLRGTLGWVCTHRDQLFWLHTDLSLTLDADGSALYARVPLRSGARHYLSLCYVRHDIATIAPLGIEADKRLAQTLRWWESWSRRCTYDGPYRAMVVRSALTLKLMTYSLSGAVVAAPTTSLPEKIGGVRNWDYRFCWLRDAVLTLSSFIDLGYTVEGAAFIGWLLHATRLTWPELQVLYDVYGQARIPEVELAHLEGYKGSGPVRIGNAAHGQLQLDVYGEVVLAAYHFTTHGGRLGADEKRMLVELGRCVCRLWGQPDHGIWEIRGPERHYTYSKMMCWAALDCLVKLHEQGELHTPIETFRHERTALAQAIENRGFNAELGSYVGAFDSKVVDASLLLMARWGYKAPNDPRMRVTYDRIARELERNGLIYRYPEDHDGLPPGEGAFVITSFWAVDYLAICGEVEKATQRFEYLLSLANDVGLYAEQIDPLTGEALGNFPQAFSHTGLITAAISLADAKAAAR